MGRKLCKFISLYRSPIYISLYHYSQCFNSFQKFVDNLRLSLDKIRNQNPFLWVFMDDFNIKSSNSYVSNKITYEDSKTNVLTSQFGLQLIKEPTHILGNSSFCIDIIFSSYANLVMKTGIHHSLDSYCHNYIKYAKFNLKSYYSPPYKLEIWHYWKANTDHIRKAMNGTVFLGELI